MTTPQTGSGSDSGQLGMVRLRLGSQIYAAPLSQVSEVITLAGHTRLFRLPPHVLGVINLRGYICPLVDLGRLLDVPCDGGKVALRVQAGVLREGRSDKPAEAAFAVDEILNVEWIPADGIAPVPLTIPERQRSFFQGLVPGSPATLLLALDHAFLPQFWGSGHD